MHHRSLQQTLTPALLETLFISLTGHNLEIRENIDPTACVSLQNGSAFLANVKLIETIFPATWMIYIHFLYP